MRKFEEFISAKIEYENIMFIDLCWANNKRGIQEISLGIKTRGNKFVGVSWNTVKLCVEDDFTITEFYETCKKYKILQCADFAFDCITYGLKLK